MVPLAAAQVPDAIAWSLPPRLAAGGPVIIGSLLRASGLALPAMAVAGSLAAMAVRWLRAGPVLLVGLLLMAAADVLGDTARSVIMIGTDRSLHGAGAGIALAGTVAIVAERQTRHPSHPRGTSQAHQRPQRRQQTDQLTDQLTDHRPDRPAPADRRLLAGWWTAFAVAGLAVAPELMRHRVSSGAGTWRCGLTPG